MLPQTEMTMRSVVFFLSKKFKDVDSFVGCVGFSKRTLIAFPRFLAVWYPG